MRRDADYALNDHIHVTYHASDKLAQALQANADTMRAETWRIVVRVDAPDSPQGDRVDTFEFDGEKRDVRRPAGVTVNAVAGITQFIKKVGARVFVPYVIVCA